MNAGSLIPAGTGWALGQGLVTSCAWQRAASEIARRTNRIRIALFLEKADGETAGNGDAQYPSGHALM
jgi:hypothetical protein